MADSKEKATIVARSLNDVPKRTGRPRKFDADLAKTLLDIISVDGQTATDEINYDDRAGAMKAAAYHKRTVAAVAPENMRIRTRVYETANGSGIFNWVVFADSAKAEKAKK